MPLTIVRTGLTSRPDEEYLRKIKELSEITENREIILMVPDRFSYIAEKKLCKLLGGAGLGGPHVMTFNQLIRATVGSGAALSSVGKQLLIRKITEQRFTDDCVFFASMTKTGFIEEMLNVFTSWKRFGVECDSLSNELEKAADGTPKRKLTALLDVYLEYNKIFEKEGFFDEAELLPKVAEVIRSTDRFKNAFIVTDGFTELVPPEIEVISAFLSVAAEVYVYIPAQREFTPIEGGIFEVPERAVAALKEMCENCGFDCKSSIMTAERKMSAEIKFLCNNYDNDEKYGGGCEAIALSHANDIYTETEHAAARIIDLICDDGYRFSDISVLCGNLNDYASCIEAVFERYKIPYFSDYKVPLSNHPVSVLLMSVFDMVEKKSFPIVSVCRYLKTGYILNNPDDTDRLTLFSTKRGLIGSMWLDDKYFKYAPNGFFGEAAGKEDRSVSESEKLIELKNIVIKPLVSYFEKSKGRKTVKAHIAAFFEYLTEIDLFGKIQKRVDDFEKIGDENEASRLTHVWNVLISMFDQMVISLGDELLTRRAFGEYLKTGIEGSVISIIPTVTNGVSVSDVGRRSGAEVRALFILGATRNTVPQIKKEDGLITEVESEFFEALPKGAVKSRINQSKEFELLRAVSETSDSLNISYSSTNANGDAEDPSVLFDALCSRFRGLTVHRFSGDELFISAPEVMLHRLLIKLSSDEEITPYYECIRDWFKSHEQWHGAFELLKEAEAYKKLTGSIPKELSAELYKSITQYSVSRLEKYYKCPFSYFLTYGLHLDNDEAFGMKSTDTGDVVHAAIAEFCSRVDARDAWNTITDKECDKLVGEIMDEYRKTTEENPKLENVFDRLQRTVCRAAHTAVLSIRSGSYRVCGNEVSFENFAISDGNNKTMLRGIIDRIDFYDDNGKKKIRIVDYKTGEKKLSLDKVLNGIDLQLVVYAMAAAEQVGGSAAVTGFFYNSLKRKIISSDTPDEAESELSKSMKLSGLVFEEKSGADYEVKNGADMDKELFSSYKSTFLPLELKNNGRYKAYSGVISGAALSTVMSEVKSLVLKAADGIEGGDVKVYPYKKSDWDSSCTFCPYSTVCMYDTCKGAQVNSGAEGIEKCALIKASEKESKA